MGASKERMQKLEDKNEVAEAIAVRVGLLEKCEDHGELFDPLNHNHEDAYKLANHLITKNDPLVDIFEGNRRDLMDRLKDICSGKGTSCGWCDARD